MGQVCDFEPSSTRPRDDDDSRRDTPEYHTMKKSANILLDFIKESPTKIGTAMFAAGFLSENQRDRVSATGGITDVDKAQILVNAMTDQVKMNPEAYHKFIDLLKEKAGESDIWVTPYLEKIERTYLSHKTFKVLLTGRAGAGKRTLIKGLLKDRIDIDDSSLDEWSNTDLDNKAAEDITVWISAHSEEGSATEDQEEYLKQLQERCKERQLTLHCIRLSADFNDEISEMKMLTQIFGRDFWKEAAIILTFANAAEGINVTNWKDRTQEEKAQAFISRFQESKVKIQGALQHDINVPERIIDSIEIVPAGHYKKPDLPGNEHWLSTVRKKCSKVIGSEEARTNWNKITQHLVPHFSGIA